MLWGGGSGRTCAPSATPDAATQTLRLRSARVLTCAYFDTHAWHAMAVSEIGDSERLVDDVRAERIVSSSRCGATADPEDPIEQWSPEADEAAAPRAAAASDEVAANGAAAPAVRSEATSSSGGSPSAGLEACSPARVSLSAQIKAMRQEQRRLKDQAKAQRKEIRNAVRRSKRLKDKVVHLSDADLNEVLIMRGEKRAAAAACRPPVRQKSTIFNP